MIGMTVLMALGAGAACASVVFAVFAVGIGHPEGAWALAPGAAAGLVALVAWVRFKRTPIDAERPGIVPGDE